MNVLPSSEAAPFVHGRCLDMASAIGRATGLPVMKLRRQNGALAHAFVVKDRHLPKASWRCVDAAGELPLHAMRLNVEAAYGPLVLSRDETPATIRGVDDDDVLAAARRIPHLIDLLDAFPRISPDAPPAGYAPVLDDARAIALHIADTSPHEVEPESTEEAFHGCRATLRWRDMADIRPSPGDGHLPIPSRERAYARMHAGTRPPIVVEDGEIQDGHHRYRTALAQGDVGMWTYEVESTR